MNIKDLSDYLFDAFPYKRRTTADWLVPAMIGIGAGAVVGVSLGLLVAPAPGEETRAKLREGAYRLKDKAMVAANNAKDQLTTAKDQLVAKANGIKNGVAGELESHAYDVGR